MTTQTPFALLRNWGTETRVILTPTHCGKVLRRNEGTKGGFQLHVKEESHYLYEGQLKLETIEDGQHCEKTIMAGMSWTVAPGTLHREEALTDCVLFEVSDPIADDRYPIVPDPGQLPPMTDQQAMEKLTLYARALRQRAQQCEGLAIQIGQDGLKSLVTLEDEIAT